MTKADLDRARIAFELAEKDLQASVLLSAFEGQHQNCGLHLQQASEKLIKTLIHLHGGEFAFRKGHMMGYLRGALEGAGGTLDPKFERLDALEIYAVDGRYNLLPDLDREDLRESQKLVEELYAEVASKLTKHDNQP